MTRKLIATLFVLSLIASACGQKPGVHVAGSSSEGSLAAGAEAGQAVDEAGNPIAGGTTAGRAGSGSTAAARGTRTSTRSGRGGSLPGGAPDRTGVTANQILVGFHAPVTGAASAPLTDIENGIDLLAEYLDERGKKIHGRSVLTLFRDDQYNPSHAVSVCREMVETKKVFLLIGGGGTDQVVACARYARGKGVPYLSAGVTENELSGFKNYFAFSATYPDQTKPLVSLIKNFTAPSGGKVYLDRCKDDGSGCGSAVAPHPPQGYGSTPKVAIIYSDTDGFTDAKDAFIREYQAQFGSAPIVTSITKFNISQNEATGKMSAYKQDGVDVVFVLTSPTNWLELLNRAAGQSYFPRWVGVGVTKGLDLVASLACNSTRRPAFENSLMLSPWFSVRHPDADQFRAAWQEVAGASRGSPNANDHDLAWGVWGGSIVQAALYFNAGKDLTRQGFIAAMEKMQNVKFPDAGMGIDIKDVYSELNYSPNNHFGAKQAHLIWGHCVAGAGGVTGYWDYFPGQGHFATDF